MELIDGKSWREHLKQARTVPLQFASAWLLDLCAAVEAAHAAGIVHRDLKPEKVMIANDAGVGRVVVLDFGLAKFRAGLLQADLGLTVAGAVMGTWAYMSPEQRSGGQVDARSDVFSTAVICAETLFGLRPPKRGASRNWLRDRRERLSLPGSEVARLLEAALNEQPNRRPPIATFREELCMALRGYSSELATIAESAAETISPDKAGQDPIR